MFKKIIFGKTNLEVSRVAFGGIPIQRLSMTDAVEVVREALGLGVNFIDTATAYTDSQEKIGLAIKDIPRHRLVLASKSGVNDKATILKDIDNSLKMLRTDYVDIYQLHNVASEEKFNAVMGEGGAYAGIMEAVKQGKVRFPGFSSHAMNYAKKMIMTDKFFSVQVPYNFIDRQAEDEVITLAKQRNMGIIAMKPLGGGLLDNAVLCFKYLLQMDGVVPDPGIEKLGQMREIVEIVKKGTVLSPSEMAEMDRIRREVGDSWCHRCDYCQPCPQLIAISTILWVRSFVKRMAYRASSWVDKEMARVDQCTECRTCVDRCPYHLDIPKLLKQNLSVWQEYISQQQR